MRRKVYPLELALETFEEVAGWLRPLCTRLEAVGSVRRERARVCDLDVLAIPRGGTTEPVRELLEELSFGERLHLRPAIDGEPNHLRCVHCATGMPLDLFFVRDLEEWTPALVWRTGGAAFLQALRDGAKKRRYLLGEGGRLELAPGHPLRYRTERELCKLLGVELLPPARRDAA